MAPPPGTGGTPHDGDVLPPGPARRMSDDELLTRQYLVGQLMRNAAICMADEPVEVSEKIKRQTPYILVGGEYLRATPATMRRVERERAKAAAAGLDDSMPEAKVVMMEEYAVQTILLTKHDPAGANRALELLDKQLDALTREMQARAKLLVARRTEAYRQAVLCNRCRGVAAPPLGEGRSAQRWSLAGGCLAGLAVLLPRLLTGTSRACCIPTSLLLVDRKMIGI